MGESLKSISPALGLEKKPKQSRTVYVIGALITVIGIEWVIYVRSSTILEIQIIAGLLCSIPVSVCTAGIHYLIQRGARWLLQKFRRFSVRTAILILNAPIFLFSCWNIVEAYLEMQPEKNFKQYVADPIPHSVGNIKFGGGGMGPLNASTTFGFRFKIDTNDLSKLIQSHRLVVETKRNHESIGKIILIT